MAAVAGAGRGHQLGAGRLAGPARTAGGSRRTASNGRGHGGSRGSDRGRRRCQRACHGVCARPGRAVCARSRRCGHQGAHLGRWGSEPRCPEPGLHGVGRGRQPGPSFCVGFAQSHEVHGPVDGAARAGAGGDRVGIAGRGRHHCGARDRRGDGPATGRRLGERTQAARRGRTWRCRQRDHRWVNKRHGPRVGSASPGAGGFACNSVPSARPTGTSAR